VLVADVAQDPLALVGGPREEVAPRERHELVDLVLPLLDGHPAIGGDLLGTAHAAILRRTTRLDRADERRFLTGVRRAVVGVARGRV
jgi:hypothetical protein